MDAVQESCGRIQRGSSSSMHFRERKRGKRQGYGYLERELRWLRSFGQSANDSKSKTPKAEMQMQMQQQQKGLAC
ncbi:hypothetical protein ACFX13_026689 [Malus domestica]